MSCLAIALIVLAVIAVWFAAGFLFWACCVAAKRADQEMEDWANEHNRFPKAVSVRNLERAD